MSHSPPAPAAPARSCRACALVLASPDDHRAHFRSDLHVYNAKRRLAALPPVSPALFAQKLAQRTPDAPDNSPRRCDLCRKTYASQNAYASHLASRRHRNALLNTPRLAPPPTPAPDPPRQDTPSPFACLFCTSSSSSIPDNLSHMSSAHSFFIPDAEYLIDIHGLLSYLAEKIALGNVCIYCNGKGRELHSLEAVRKHMLDKGHCKIAYDTEPDRLEISDYYDFTSSYPSEPSSSEDNQPNSHDDSWQDVDQDDDGGDDGDDDNVSVAASHHSDTIPDNQLTYGDTEYELVLPSGARVGHRSMMRYYAQSFHGIPTRQQDPNSGVALVRRLLADKHSALVPRKGGFGAFGQGTQVVKARNKGEAREAGRHITEFRDQRRREDFKTKVAFVHNNQKHFRDPLLQ